MASIESMLLDVEELKTLEQKATRKKVKDILSIEIRKIQTDITSRQAKEHQDVAAASGATAGSGEDTKTPDPSKQANTRKAPRPMHNITTYGWDQSEKFMKLYLTINGIHKIPQENITSEFSERGVKLMVSDFENKNHQLLITRLLEEIIPADSYHKVKTDMILVMLKKNTPGKTWAYVTQREEKEKSKDKAPKPEGSKDPGDGLMNMLQEMYESGDDEMKRSIQKAWHDSKDKNPGGMGGMGMGGMGMGGMGMGGMGMGGMGMGM